MSNLKTSRYSGDTAPAFNQPFIIDQLSNIPALINSCTPERLSHGADYVIKIPLKVEVGEIAVTIKIFKPQNLLKDSYDRRNGSKAERSYRAACFLREHGIGTPHPIAWRERWENGRLLESYYICVFEPGISFRDALSDIYYQQRNNAPLIDLLHLVAPAIRAMHDAGFMHGDMGNQNILLPRSAMGEWLQPQFIDLNRSKYSKVPLSDAQRAFDLARIALPGAYLKIFKWIYNQHQDLSAEFDRSEQKARKHFWSHRRSSKWRHPIRHWKNRRKKGVKPIYPPMQDIWLWDEKSAQPMITPNRLEKNSSRDWRYMFSMLWQGLCAAPGIYKHYRNLLKHSYGTDIDMQGRIGVALHPHPDYINIELELLEKLGNPPVMLRICHHETLEDWNRTIDLVKKIRSRDINVTLAVLQDRQALLQPASWENFLRLIFENLGDQVAQIEITHASNRLKWGIWSSDEYQQLMEPALRLQRDYPHVRLIGPACIDFEYLPVIAALGTHPKEQPLAALSHLLYVDRRGAPENTQGNKFSTLEKAALLKALAQWSDRCDDKIIVSEVNWPVKGTGIWSPIGCPYETPRWRREQPGETEDEYANYMLRYLAITLCSGHVEQVFWWRLSAHGYGLVDDCDNFRIRPAFNALAFFLKTVGRATFVRKLNTPDDVFVLEFTHENRSVWMAWALQESEYQPDFPFSQAFDREGEPVTSVKLTGSPLYLFS